MIQKIAAVTYVMILASCTSVKLQPEMIDLKVAAYKKILTTWNFENKIIYCSSGKNNKIWEKENDEVFTQINDFGFQQASEEKNMPISFVRILSIKPNIVIELGVDDIYSGYNAKYVCIEESSGWKFKELEITQYGKSYDK